MPKFSVLLISKRKDQAAKFVVSQIYRAYQKETVKLPFQRGKETTYKITFQAIADLNRPVGDRGGKIYGRSSTLGFACDACLCLCSSLG